MPETNGTAAETAQLGKEYTSGLVIASEVKEGPYMRLLSSVRIKRQPWNSISMSLGLPYWKL